MEINKSSKVNKAEGLNFVEVGQLLQQKRTEMNLTLREVESALSIRTAYLQAIEEGQINQLISPLYAQGFLRQYASFLNIDGDQLLRDNPEIFSKIDKQDFSYGIGTLEGRGNPGAGVKWLPNMGIVAAFALICLAAWLLASFLGVL